MKTRNITDQLFSDHLRAIRPDSTRARYWLAACTRCHLESSYRKDTLKAHTARCECSDTRISHNASDSDLYRTWTDVKQRVKRQPYKYPIEIQPEWAAKGTGFRAFRDYVLSSLGPRLKGQSLDRIDVFNGYVKGNLRWATDVEQANNRTSNKPIESPEFGAALTASEWAGYIREQTGRSEFTRQRVLTLLEHLGSIERIIAAYHPHRASPEELRERKRFSAEFDRHNTRVTARLLPSWTDADVDDETTSTAESV